MVRQGAGHRLRAVLLLTLSFLLPLPAGAESQAEAQARLEALRGQIGQLQKELERTRGRYDGLSRKLRDTEQRIARVSRKLRSLEAELGKRQRRLAELRSEQIERRAELGDQRQMLGGQVRAAYAMGRQQYLKILLNQQSPAVVGRISTYYDYLNRARTERIGDLLQTLQALERLEHEIAEERRKLAEARDARLAEQRELQASRRDRAQVVSSLKRELSSKGVRLERMQKDERELLGLLESLAEVLADIPAEPGDRRPFAELKGKMTWPTRGPLLVRYGEPRKVGSMRWQGVMIQAGEGQAVRAISHGRVAFADWLRGYGLLIIIDHGDGYMSLYGHNQSLYKETGDWVEADEAIATVGDSGGQQRSALYFEIRRQGKPTDPRHWCRG